jgi:hypothetical protein
LRREEVTLFSLPYWQKELVPEVTKVCVLISVEKAVEKSRKHLVISYFILRARRNGVNDATTREQTLMERLTEEMLSNQQTDYRASLGLHPFALQIRLRQI